ncbi:hypothetical protein [Barrientosiimonas endolithica]|uniref:Homoserine kinase n=1 Tax=Barrientosiimonas endolithica TaxID=1535208 RepID=A0ABM8H8J9_9MICO|nr:hypothetical protein [Barrientosiimonas endolithica]BDZ57220.1 hypothetical protein GCM10025872_08770 [Barrientosiimonas endolithica]
MSGELRPVPTGQRVALQVPASSANLGPGFDSVGLALDLWDDVEVEVTGDRLVIECEGRVPTRCRATPRTWCTGRCRSCGAASGSRRHAA